MLICIPLFLPHNVYAKPDHRFPRDCEPGKNAMTDYAAHIAHEIQESVSVKKELGRVAEQISEAATAIVNCLRAGGKLIVFGNGGSASDAQHMVAELVGRYAVKRQALAAIALPTNASSLTAIANDFGFEEIFARQLEALAK